MKRNMMMKEKTLKSFTMPTGIEVDLKEGWKKITSSMFGGKPGRGFGELIQNFMDSYDDEVPFPERRGVIETGSRSVSIKDFGSGLDRKKIELILKLGGTDKADDKSKIGMFGVGFFSIFNPRLGTERVVVTTNCEGSPVTLNFEIHDSSQPPEIEVKPVFESIEFSTRVEVFFRYQESVDECIRAAKHALMHYPCQVTIDGKPFQSIWEEANRNRAHLFHTNSVHGFIKQGTYRECIHMMCKYEPILTLSPNEFVTGGYSMKHTIEDLYSDSMPCLPKIEVYANCNDLRVPLGRNGYYLDQAWRNMKAEISKVLIDYLDTYMDHHQDQELILANQYILRHELSAFLKSSEKENFPSAVRKLAEAKIYPINGKKEKCSLVDLKHRRNASLPVFFSQYHHNLRWLGGQFKHDFIVLAPEIYRAGRIPGFYDDLFGALFGDVVNLDTVQQDNKKLCKLVEKGIISKDMLKPEVRIVGEKELSPNEQEFLADIQDLLKEDEVRQVISENLQIRIERLTPVFIYVAENQGYIASGLFDSEGYPVDEYFISNCLGEDKQIGPRDPVHLLLGISLNHPLIKQLIDSSNPYRIYYSLTYLAHELALSQKLLVPYSPFFHFIKDKLAGGMRRALISVLISRKKAA